MKVFIIDDDPIIIAIISNMLMNEGIEIKYTLSPISDCCYQEIEKFSPDVILLDIYLKDETGYEVAEKIRKIKSLKNIPILAISSSKTIDDKIEAFTHGFIDYIEKPFSKNRIASVVKTYGKLNTILRKCDKLTELSGIKNAYSVIINKK